MKLGTDTGSLVNHISTHGQTDTMPSLGDGATIFSWSDGSPHTVIMVDVLGGLVQVQADTANRIDRNGMSESQDYEYTPNPDGAIQTYKLVDGTRWFPVYKSVETGRYRRSGRPNIRFGRRNKYHDYSF